MTFKMKSLPDSTNKPKAFKAKTYRSTHWDNDNCLAFNPFNPFGEGDAKVNLILSSGYLISKDGQTFLNPNHDEDFNLAVSPNTFQFNPPPPPGREPVNTTNITAERNTMLCVTTARTPFILRSMFYDNFVIPT